MDGLPTTTTSGNSLEPTNQTTTNPHPSTIVVDMHGSLHFWTGQAKEINLRRSSSPGQHLGFTVNHQRPPHSTKHDGDDKDPSPVCELPDCSYIVSERETITQIESKLQRGLDDTVQTWMNSEEPPISQWDGHVMVKVQYQLRWIRSLPLQQQPQKSKT